MGGMKGLLNVGVNPKTLQDTVAAIPKGLGLSKGKAMAKTKKAVKRGKGRKVSKKRAKK